MHITNVFLGIYGSPNGEFVKRLDKDFKKIVPLSLLYEDTCPQHLRDNMTDKIRKFYFGDRTIDESMRYNVIDVSSNHKIIYNSHDMLKIHRYNISIISDIT